MSKVGAVVLGFVALISSWAAPRVLAEEHPRRGALSPEELEQLPGFSRDHEANLREAKRLLAEAGYPDGFKTVLTNRKIKLPSIDLAIYLISAWKKIGVEAEHKVEETATRMTGGE
jgi:ABC-type transport system substrate-binding protein